MAACWVAVVGCLSLPLAAWQPHVPHARPRDAAGVLTLLTSRHAAGASLSHAEVLFKLALAPATAYGRGDRGPHHWTHTYIDISMNIAKVLNCLVMVSAGQRQLGSRR